MCNKTTCYVLMNSSAVAPGLEHINQGAPSKKDFNFERMQFIRSGKRGSLNEKNGRKNIRAANNKSNLSIVCYDFTNRSI